MAHNFACFFGGGFKKTFPFLRGSLKAIYLINQLTFDLRKLLIIKYLIIYSK